jgi:Kef-type K+ transport system membrane component KefB
LEAVLLIAAVLIYVGYLAVRTSRHLRVPVVTSFLVLGIIGGPEVLGLVNASALETLKIVEPVALGMITFAAGEQLFFRDVRALSRRSYAVVALETLLPPLLVGVGVWLLTGRLEIALPVAAIAGTTGLATVMSTLKESGAKGNYAKLLGFSIATDNFFAILAFSLLLPLAVGLETGGAIGHLYADRLAGMAASVAIGCAAGALVAFLVRRTRSSHELLMLVLAHVLVVVGVTEYLGFSILLAGLAMGTTAANLTRDERYRERVFAALMSLEYPVIAIFFLWAGAGLHIRALGDIGLLFAVYVVARLVGKLAGPLLTALIMRNDQEPSRRFLGLGMSLVPQAGAAVGLAILARDMLPESGETILVAVLAAVVVFELVGPVGVHWAARHVGEAQVASEDEPLTLSEAITELKNRRPVVAVVLCPESDPSLLQMPRLLAARLGADLLLVPVSDAAVPPPASWVGALSTEGEEGRGQGDESTISGCREVVVDTVPVENGSAERLVSLLVESKPAVVLLAPEGLPGCVFEVADELSDRLGCPVFKIPEPETARRRHLWSVRRLAEVIGRSRIAQRSRDTRRGRGISSDS